MKASTKAIRFLESLSIPEGPKAGQAVKLAPKMDKEQIIVMNLCGRGDKDIFTVADALGVEI